MAVDVRVTNPDGQSALGVGAFAYDASDGVWPPVMPAEPSAAEIAQMKAGLGYPERRCYKSAQWHDSEFQDVDNMRHMHVELACPERVTAGVHRFDLFTTLFHFQGGIFQGIRKVVARTNIPTTQKWMPVYVPGWEGGRRYVPIPLGSEGHLLEHWTPMYLDLRTVPFGFYTFEVDIQVVRPDLRIANARIIWKMWVGEGVTDRRGYTHGEGWVSPDETSGNQFGYMTCTLFRAREFESDPVQPVIVKAAAKVGRTVRLMICKNPDLHQHPAFYGEILHDWTFVASEQGFEQTIPQPALSLGDRLMARIVDATDPDIGSGATLAVLKLCAG